MPVTVVPVVELKPVAGAQLYPEDPLAVKVAETVGQIVALLTVTVVEGVMVTTVVAVAAGQFPEEPVTVYVVVELGLAVTVAPVVLLNPTAGDQL